MSEIATEALQGLRHSTPERCQDSRYVAREQSLDVEPQAREEVALNNPLAIGLDADVLTVAQAKPVERAVEHTPDQVLAHAVAKIGAQFIVEVVGGRAGGHLNDQLRSALQVALLVHARA